MAFLFNGIFKVSRALRARGTQTYGTAGHTTNNGGGFRWYSFGNPWRDDYPQWIWQSLRHSRKDKDIFAPLFRLFNSTRIYEVFLKDNRRYCIFVMSTGVVTSWMWSEMWNSYWRKVNKGKLYNDVPYVYPQED